MMVRTNQFEIDNDVGSSFLDCFKGVDLRRTEIVCLAWPAQILAGSSFANQPTYFFQQAGISSDVSFKLGLGVTALAFVGTCASWFVMTVGLISILILTPRFSTDSGSGLAEGRSS
jgi:SP family general alpha glucoside:H+ symporter-like MFS transporter